MFSATVSESNSAPDWKTIVTRRRISRQLIFGPIGDVLAGDEHAPRVRPQKSHDMLQRDRFSHAAAPHDDARLAVVHEEADVVEHQVIAKRLADVAEFDVVARRGRLRLVQVFARPCSAAIVDEHGAQKQTCLVGQASACLLLTSVSAPGSKPDRLKHVLRKPLWKFAAWIRISD